MNSITLIHGNCLKEMQDLSDQSVDFICADLPYSTTQNRFDKNPIPLEELWNHYKRIIKPHGVIALFAQEPFGTKLRSSNLKNWKYDWVWHKKTPGGFLNAKKRPLKVYEQILIFSYGTPLYYPQMEVRGNPRYKGTKTKRIGNGDMAYGHFETVDSYNNTYYPTNLLEYSNAVQIGKIHPSQKPVELIEYLIKTYTQEGETVLDNCSGSGSTVIAAINTKRNCIAMELDDEYYESSKNRITQHLAESENGSAFLFVCGEETRPGSMNNMEENEL